MVENTFLFISHAASDKKIVGAFVELLYRIGLLEKDMFCSSISELGVPIKEDIYGYLRNLLDSDNVIPVFMLSKNYYQSAACLNEMGAVWLKQNDYFTFILPGFTFKDIKGAINPSKRAIKLENSNRELKEDLTMFKNSLCTIFDLAPISEQRWEWCRDEFIDSIQRISLENNQKISFDIHDSEGLCIDFTNHGGCDVVVNDVVGKVSTTVDFSKTPAQLCSLVFFAGGINIQEEFNAGKNLCFDLRASEKLNVLSVELHLASRNIHKKLNVSNEWEHYCIPLADFSRSVRFFDQLNEIGFVVDRVYAEYGVFEIKNLEIS